MKAVIMAGGEGSRLRPLTCRRPKPMIPVANVPVMEHIVELLKGYDIRDIGVTLQYLPDSIREYFGDGSGFGVRMRYFVEEKPLGTAGSVKNAENFLDDTFLVISGDALTDVDLGDAIDFHRSRNAMATLILKRVDVPLEYGVAVTDKDGKIMRFLEKPGWGEAFSDTVNTGIYILSPEIFQYMKRNEVFDFSKDLFPVLLKENKPLYGYTTEKYWCDIGDINAYIQAHADIMLGKVKISIRGREQSNGIWIGDGTVIDRGAKLTAPCIVGSGCHIRSGSDIGSFSIIGNNSMISEYCSLKKSIVWENCMIGAGVQLRGSIICGHVNLKKGVSVFEQAIVGDYSLIDEQVIIRPGVMIWPDKYVEPDMEVSSNLVWGSRANRQVFGNRGVAGEINIDMTPEFAARMGAAYGAVHGKKGAIGISCDDSPAALMIKNAMVSGLISAGIFVNDFEKLLLPAMRSAVRFYRLKGGIHISTCTGKKSRLMIDFLDMRGSNIDRNTERKIENVFIRDDFNRCEGDCLKGVKEIKGFSDFYLRNIIQNMKSESLDYKIALKAGSPFISQTLSELLEDIGCTVETVSQEPEGTEQERLKQESNLPGIQGVGDFCSFVKHGGFDMGVSVEESCEKMLLVDENGRLITDDMFIALISLVLFRSVKGGTVVVPVTASQVVDKMADEYRGKVIRTKASTRDVMGKLLDRSTKEEMLEQFTMHFDSVAGFIKLLDFLSVNQTSLSSLVDMIPEIHMHRQEVECSWNAKGKVIRKLIQEHSGSKIETLEGVKMYTDNGWVLVLPDNDKPVCNVIGEGMNAEFAEELTNIYVRKVREISRS